MIDANKKTFLEGESLTLMENFIFLCSDSICFSGTSSNDEAIPFERKRNSEKEWQPKTVFKK